MSAVYGTRPDSTIRLELPFTAPPLRDNDRYPHWAVKARKIRELRGAALLLALAAKLPKGLDRVRITLHWQPATNRHRDELSIAPTLKPLVDGLTDYGLVADDDTKHVSLSCCVHDWQRGVPAACWLTIEPTSGGQQ